MQSVGLMCRFVSLNTNYRRGDMSRGNGTVEVRMGENQIGRPGAVLNGDGGDDGGDVCERAVVERVKY